LKAEYFKIHDGKIGILVDKEINKNDDSNMLLVVGEPITNDIASIHDYKDAINIIPSFDGAFIAIYLDKKNKKIIIVSDILGLQPFYYYHDGEVFLAAGETKAFGTERDIPGWGAFFSWGHLIGTRTLVKNVEKLDSATVLIFDLKTKVLSKKKYWSFNKAKVGSVDYNIDDIVDSFKQSLNGYSNLLHNSQLLLSGGLDSRFILFSLKSMNIVPSNIIISHDDEYRDLDGRIAELCAQSVNAKFKKINIASDFFSSSHFLDYLKLSDASTSSLFLFISKISHVLKELSPTSVFDGFIPDKMLKAPPYLGGGGMKDFVSQNSHSVDSKTWQVVKRIFNTKIVEEMYEGYSQDLKNEIEKYPDDSFGVSEFNLLNRGSRRIAINPVQVYANYTRPIIPGMTKNFLTITSSMPCELKENNKLYIKIFEKAYPKACKVPFVSGGQLISPRKNMRYLMSKLMIHYCNCVRKYPSVSKPLMLQNKHSNTDSRFFSSKVFEDDTHILVDNLKKIDRNDPQYTTAWRIAFHWHAWNLVHKGQTYELMD
jgi:hypothetical protein